MKKTHKEFLLLLGRVCLVLVLLVSAVPKLRFPGGTAQYMAGLGMPGASEALAYLAGAFEFAAGLAVLVGWKTRWAAVAIVVYLLPITWYTHLSLVWAAADPVVRDQETYQSLKNLSLMGGLLLLAAMGPGSYSMDRK
ncbi:MAG: DoxX family protein [Candidatus Coatesbacteria bacterium]